MSVNEIRARHAPLVFAFHPHDGLLLSELEGYSEAYVLREEADDGFSTLLHEISAACTSLLSTRTPDDFKVELEGLTRDGFADRMLGNLMRSTSPVRKHDRWPMVFDALRGVLNSKAADIFLEGLTLMSIRGRYFSRLASIIGDGDPEHGEIPKVKDPDASLLFFEARKADTCLIAVLGLISRRQVAESWMASELAETFRRGQAAGVRALASLFDDEESERALEIAKQSRFDWRGRLDNAKRVEEKLRALAGDGTEVVSPFGPSPYDDEYEWDNDEWTQIG